MFYARYQIKVIDVKIKSNGEKEHTETVVDERWIGIDAGKQSIAEERASQIKPPSDRFMPEEAVTQIDVFDERDMLDLRLDRAYVIEKLGERNPSAREEALAETLNLLRETLQDLNKHLTIRDEHEYVVRVIRIDDIFKAIDSGWSGSQYLSTDTDEFNKERSKILKNLFGDRLTPKKGEKPPWVQAGQSNKSTSKTPTKKQITQKKTSKKK